MSIFFKVICSFHYIPQFISSCLSFGCSFSDQLCKATMSQDMPYHPVLSYILMVYPMHTHQFTGYFVLFFTTVTIWSYAYWKVCKRVHLQKFIFIFFLISSWSVCIDYAPGSFYPLWIFYLSWMIVLSSWQSFWHPFMSSDWPSIVACFF